MQVYILYGDDKFNIKRYVEKTKQKIDNGLLNYCLMPDDSTPYSIINELLTPPLIGNNKIIHVSNDCLFKDSENAKKAIKGKLELVPTNNILIITTDKKPASNAVIVKELLRYGTIQEFSLLSSWKINELSAYIKDAAILKGLNLSQQCISYLVDSIGNNTELIDSELTKIVLYTKTSNIELEQLRALVNNSHNNSVELAKYCLEGNAEKAYNKLNQLKSEHPLQVVAALTTCFRTWLAVKAGIDNKLNDVEIASIGNIYNPRRIYFLKDEVRSCSLVRLKDILSILAQLEYELKTGKDTLITRIIEISESP